MELSMVDFMVLLGFFGTDLKAVSKFDAHFYPKLLSFYIKSFFYYTIAKATPKPPLTKVLLYIPRTIENMLMLWH